MGRRLTMDIELLMSQKASSNKKAEEKLKTEHSDSDSSESDKPKPNVFAALKKIVAEKNSGKSASRKSVKSKNSKKE